MKPRADDQDDADAHEERLYFVENPDKARLSDLDTAIESNEAHLRWLYQAETGNLRAARGKRTESREDLVKAVELLRTATADPQTSPDLRGKLLFTLGNLLSKGELAESFGNLSEGVDAYRQALELLTGEERLACVSNMLPELLAVADRSDRPEPREEARALTFRFLDEAATNPVSEISVWHTLIDCLHSQAVPTDLHLALITKAETLAHRPASDSVRGNRYHRLGQLLNNAWDRTGDRSLLTRSIEAYRQAAALRPTEGTSVANLALALREAGALDGDPKLLEEAVGFGLTALEFTPRESDDYVSMRGDLAATLIHLSEFRDQEDNLRAALDQTTEVVEHGRRTGNFELLRSFLPNLAMVRLRLGMVTDDRGLKAEAVDAYREALALPLSSRTRATLLAAHGSALAQLAEHDDRPAVKLHQANQAMAEALSLLPDNAPQLGGFLHAYALNVLTLTMLDDSAAAHDTALAAWERILARATSCSLPEPALLCRALLAINYWGRYDHGTDVGDLARAIDHGEHALRDRQPGLANERQRLAVVYAVTEAYRLRALVGHDHADFERALSLVTEALERPDVPPRMRQSFLTVRSATHHDRFNIFSRPSDLDEALRYAQQAAAVPVPTGPESAARLQLATCLSQKYQQSGVVEHLDRALEIWRAAWASIRARTGEEGVDPPARYDDSGLSIAYNLTTALAQRYNLHQIPSDLDEALDTMAIVLRHTPENHSLWPDRLTAAANMLRSRCSRDDSPDDLSQALSYAEQAVTTANPGSHAHFNAVAALLSIHADGWDGYGGGVSEDDGDTEPDAGAPGNELLGGHTESLDRAIEFGVRQAESEDELPLRSWIPLTNNTAVTLYRRWRAFGDHKDLDRSISLLRQVLHRAGVERSALSALVLGETLLHHSRTDDTVCALDSSTSAPEARREAAAAFRSLATCVSAPSRARFQAARRWVTVTGRPDDETLAACRQLMELMPLVAWVGAPRTVREAVLEDESVLVPMAALAALEAGRPADAVEFLELGRSVLWSQSLDLRTDLAEIEEADPELAARLAEVREALDSPTADGEAADLLPVAGPSGLVPPDPVDPDWSAVIQQAQRISASGDRDGLYDLLGPLTSADDTRVAGYAEFGRGLALIDRGEPEAAREALVRAAEHDSPFAAAAANTLGDLLVATHDYAGARVAYKRARDSDDQKESVSAAARLGRLDEIEAAETRLAPGLARLLVLGDVPELLAMAGHLLQQGQISECRLFLERAFPRIPSEDHPAMASFLALVRQRTGDVPGARSAWELALTAEDPEAAAHAALRLGDLLTCEYTLDEARSAYARALDFPGMTDEARACLAGLSVRSPNEPSGAQEAPLTFDYGYWLAHRRPMEEALTVLNQVVEAGCADPRAHYYLYDVTRLRGKPEPQWSRDRLHRVLALSPGTGTPLALIARSRLRDLRGDQEGAISILDDAYSAAVAQGDAELATIAALTQATHHQHHKNYDDAHDAYQRAIRAGHPQLSLAATFYLAVMLGEAGREEESRSTYRHLMTSGHPVQGGMAAMNLGMSLGRADDIDGAVEAFKWAANGAWEESAAHARDILARLSADSSDAPDSLDPDAAG
ncbi:hypothetical protein GCM10014715_56520 [Streptomyces spiralis]|uniref:Tetratricopeptide repeat protein n=1 Tax=Streptomyces spiralis TaxID=66376 RepID=A0A919A9S9_9ACTN|nr:tetratricopeptide repeat protein [Streptomyces spiralis]GHE92757.1 hypothetical protein GCM10014715_56520 [Streptomyces spiralis]